MENVRMGNVRIGHVRIGHVRMGRVRMGPVRMGQYTNRTICVGSFCVKNILIGPMLNYFGGHSLLIVSSTETPINQRVTK